MTKTVFGLSPCLLLAGAACTAASAETDTDQAQAATSPSDVPGFPGSKLYTPATTPAPGIVMLHGSEGGSAPYIQGLAQQISRSGFVVMTLCWFGCPGKPDQILDIPLESVVDAGQWLSTSPAVGGSEVGLFGWSRGAEMSLLTTSLAGTAPFRAVAVHAPSDTVVAAYDPSTANSPPYYGGIMRIDPVTGVATPAPSWTWRGTELFGEPKPDFSVPGPIIEVTHYAGPVSVSQGENDEIWSVARGRHVVAERSAVPGLVTESHFYPNEGHVLQKPADVATMTRELTSFFQRNLGASH